MERIPGERLLDGETIGPDVCAVPMALVIVVMVSVIMVLSLAAWESPYRSESSGTAIDSFHQSALAASLPLPPSSVGAACQEKTHMKNMTASAATASVIPTAATIRKSSSIGGLPAAISVRRIQS